MTNQLIMRLRNKGVLNHAKQLLIIVAIVSFCSLFFFNFLVEGFIITISVIVLPILLYLYSEINPMESCFYVAIGSPLFRMMSLRMGGMPLEEAFSIIRPEIFFYITYGIVFYSIYNKKENQLAYFPVAVFLSDFIGNLAEMGIRTQIVGLNVSIIRGIAAVAFSRTVIVFVAVILIRYFKTFLIRQEHEEHYRRLLLLTSTFWSEIYFMEKNMIYIEDLMQQAYKLHKRTEELQSHEDVQALSLSLSMGIHEVKKDYIRVIQGLEGVTEKKLYDMEMSMRDIAEVIELSTKKALIAQERNVTLQFDVRSDTRVKYHFYMTSVLRNLINNSIEALKDKPYGIVKVWIFEQGNFLKIIVEDNGCGIRESDLEFIFNRGFSSKYDHKSGDVQRGLGLSIVKGFIETHFEGTIDVESMEGKGTKFTLKIALNILKGGII